MIPGQPFHLLLFLWMSAVDSIIMWWRITLPIFISRKIIYFYIKKNHWVRRIVSVSNQKLIYLLFPVLYRRLTLSPALHRRLKPAVSCSGLMQLTDWFPSWGWLMAHKCLPTSFDQPMWVRRTIVDLKCEKYLWSPWHFIVWRIVTEIKTWWIFFPEF